MDFVDKAVKGTGQVTQLILTGNCQTASQIALACGDVIEVVFHQAQWAQQGACQHDTDNADNDKNK